VSCIDVGLSSYLYLTDPSVNFSKHDLSVVRSQQAFIDALVDFVTVVKKESFVFQME
jgi:hypothetical protein